MSTAIHAGGCFCGAVRYQVAAAPRFVCICHCQSCRRACGGSMVAWATFPDARFTITAGALTEHESSRGVMRGLCSRCGTALTYRSQHRPGEIDLTLSSLDDAATLPPSAHIWTEDKLPWVVLGDSLPRHARTVPG